MSLPSSSGGKSPYKPYQTQQWGFNRMDTPIYEAFKPYRTKDGGVCYGKYTPSSQAGTVALPAKQAAESESTLEKANQVWSILASIIDSSKTIDDAQELSSTISRLKTMSSQLKIIVRSIHITEITQIVTFLDESTIMIEEHMRSLRVTRISTNLSEVEASLATLNEKMGTMLRRFGALVSNCVAWVNQKFGRLPSKFGEVVKGAEEVVTNLTRGGSVMKSLVGSWGGILGAYFSLFMLNQRQKEYEADPRSDEKYNKYMVEGIGFFVSLFTFILGCIVIYFGGVVFAIIGLILLVYGIVNAVAGIKYGHQDLLAEEIYYHRHIDQIKDLGNQLWTWTKSLPGKISQAINNLYHWLISKAQELGHEAVEGIGNYVKQKAADIIETGEDYLIRKVTNTNPFF